MWSNRESLPDEADNYDVFCVRCKKVHKYYTFTKQDWDKVIKKAADNLAEHFLEQALKEFDNE